MFVAMNGASGLFEQARVYLSGSRDMYGHVALRIGNFERNVGELLSDVLGASDEKRSSLAERAVLDKAIFSAV